MIDDAAPGDAAGGVPGQEGRVVHLRHARERRHDRTEERRPAPEEDRRATTAAEEVLGALDPVPVPVERPELHDRPPRCRPTSKPTLSPTIGGDHDDDEHRGERHVAERGRDAAEDGDGLAGHDEADEERVLDEDDGSDDKEHEPDGGVAAPGW